MKTPKKTQVKQAVIPASPDKDGASGLISILDAIARDESAPGATRTAAARAVMEAGGLLGKHQRAPGDVGPAVPLGEATRPELEAELTRLRLHFAAQRNTIT